MPTFKKSFASKIFSSLESLGNQVGEWRRQGESIVFTNGCFDILHLGHITYLEEASTLGGKLIVAINGDDSVRRLKGKNRPLQDEKARLSLVAALESVDGVVIFSEDTPLQVIQAIRPDVLVKGGDYSPEQIVGSDVVLSYGGRVLSLSLLKGYSTTNLENKVKNHGQ